MVGLFIADFDYIEGGKTMDRQASSHLSVRIYYEDTDCGGVVYYANYLRYFERARTELLREYGIELREWAGKGTQFVVTRVEIDYKAPARYADLLYIDTAVTKLGKASLTFSHSVRDPDNRLISESTVILVCTVDGRPRRIPDEITSRL